ncbi:MULTISPECIES: high frequency lysogenization protein HflD [Thalassotalea]|uniref:high frequency lysogenization protein HflD n=1 Tax=Thalassotalea TaxID=1518149 RepID=UPI0009420C95|nr:MULTISPECIES: high frequency lysogenization protein HflD [Thalassotalea]OKY27234.1 lysogenization regulator HflD [Thalassotalea sp. PP2-459]
MQNIQEQTITLAAICQISYLVQKLARHGQSDNEALSIMLNSILVTSPKNTMEVYGGELQNIRKGLSTLVSHLGNGEQQKDPEVTRYVVSLLSLERRLTKNNKQLAALGNRIEQCQRQLDHFSIESDTIIASLASIYSDIISPLGTPIQVAGNPEILKNTANQHKIRALLLAGMRSAVLWRQLGGKRRSILFSRAKIVACAQQLLKQM